MATTRILEDINGKEALEALLREIMSHDGGQFSYTSNGSDGRKEEIERRLLARREWPTYRDAPRIDKLSHDVIRANYLRQSFACSFYSIRTGEPIIAEPSVSPIIAVLAALGRKDEVKTTAEALGNNGNINISFTAAEMDSVRKYVAGYGYVNSPDVDGVAGRR